MIIRRARNLRRTCLLGALNGLSAGASAQTAYWLYDSYQRSNRPVFADMVIDYASPMPWWVIPVLAFMSFTLGSFLAHKFFARRVTSDLLFWQCVGAVAVLCGIATVAALTALEATQSEYAQTQLGNLLSSLYLPVYFSAFAFVACLNLLYGRLITTYAHS
jgi:uncharacterized membrane protein HdeD (DUF308 family)